MYPLKYNLFHFAPSELSHSAFWAWVLQSTEVEGMSHLDGPCRVGRRLLNRIGMLPPEHSIRVETEVPLEKGGGRLDIQVQVDDRTALVIENKVSALPDSDQLDRYAKSLDLEGKEVHLVIMSTAFDDDLRGKLPKNWLYLGIEEQLQLVAPDRDQHPLIADYTAWIEDTYRQRLDKQHQALGGDPLQREQALKTPEGQYALMAALTSSFSGKQYRGQNLSGTPWTQFSFCDDTEACCYDSLFYRIDVSASGAYLALRQYQYEPRPSSDAKRQRRDELRQLWSEMCQQYSPRLIPEKPRNRGTKESEIGLFLLSKNSPVILQHELPKIHAAFTAQLVARGWPIEEVPSVVCLA